MINWVYCRSVWLHIQHLPRVSLVTITDPTFPHQPTHPATELSVEYCSPFPKSTVVAGDDHRSHQPQHLAHELSVEYYVHITLHYHPSPPTSLHASCSTITLYLYQWSWDMMRRHIWPNASAVHPIKLHAVKIWLLSSYSVEILHSCSWMPDLKMIIFLWSCKFWLWRR
jgi:hypothetical protein